METNQMNDNILNNSTDLGVGNQIKPYMLQVSNLNKPLLTIHADGRITVSEDLKPTETAAEVLKIMQDMWLSNQQVVKIRELKEKIKQLEEALESIREYWNRNNNNRALVDACWYAIDTASEALEAKEAKP